MRNLFVSVQDAAALIRSGRKMLVAGSHAALAALPVGDWIGGSTPYFITPEGGVRDHDRVFCTVLEDAPEVRIDVLAEDELGRLCDRRFAQGFTYALVPAFSPVHQRFAIEVPDLPALYAQPLVGWVAGVDLADIGRVSPCVVDGRTGQAHTNATVVMYVSLAGDRFAEADIINLFTAGAGDDIAFDTTGFSAIDCRVNGVKTNFAAYLRRTGVDTVRPLVSNYAGAMVNVSFRAVGPDQVDFYAPVVAGRLYRLAAPVGDYAAAYGACCQAEIGAAMLSFNCILNYLYAGLEGHRTGDFVGPVTFGEIAYILLNQTLVRLDVTASGMLAAA
jgi:hypothetical protein